MEKEELQEETPIVEQNEKLPNYGAPKKKNKLVLPIILVLLIVVLLVGFYFFQEKLIPKNKTTKKTDVKEVYSEYRMSGNGLESFDLAFLQLENNQKNMVYSPLSIKYALEMLQEGAAGQTKEQIRAVVGDYQPRKYPNNEHMSFANAMFIRNTFQDSVNEKYIQTLKEKYNAEVILDPFENPNTINNWVSEKTFKLVNNIVEDTSDKTFLLVNALAIDMFWTNQVHCATGHRIPCAAEYYSIYYPHERLKEEEKQAYGRSSSPYNDENEFPAMKFDQKENIKSAEILADFNRYDIIKDLGEEYIRKTVTEAYHKWLPTEEGQQVVQYDPEALDVEKSIDKYMEGLKSNYGKEQHSTDFSLYVDDDVKVFAKDLQEYDGMTLQYVGIMPKKVKLADYIKTVKSDDITTLIQNLKEVKMENFKEGVATRIIGHIPFFKFEYELNLIKDLQELGIVDAFGEKSDLSNIAKEAVITEASHKANIEFSNDGIKAAAVTSMGAGATSGPFFEYLWTIPVEEIDITFDQPYLFFIRDKETGEVWFTGTVYEPITK